MFNLSRILSNSSPIVRRLRHFRQRKNIHCISYLTSLNLTKINQVPEIYSGVKIANSNKRLPNFTVNTSPSCSSVRLFSTKDESDGENRPAEEDTYNTQLPATVAVPEVWPHLPVIAVSRNIVFPRFIKLIEVSVVFFIYSFNCTEKFYYNF